ncbi:hypothetical protein [Treponema bryantii]|uniref:hypothetical protein n=1 Tax=Treponema bryantii TaxID=163 RepID=UPI0003B37482|nr:hypothetical protein [Treponema bryantii]
MLGQREVILVGLGKFGETVSNNLVHMIDERKVQLGKIANSVILHTINFADDSVFHSTNYMNEILETVKESYAFKTGEKFDFIFTGDFIENATSKYAIDFAYIPYLLQQTTAFKVGEVIGFFTFAADLGVVEKVPDETLALICKHFTQLDTINKKDTYQVPYKTVMNKTFKNVDSSAGPFNRNYVLVTPGKSNAVANETGIVFAERIFYELFYLTKKLSEQNHNYISAINDRENSDKNLSCFSMVQIPRINEVQKYYLKYLFEEEIVSSFIKEPNKGTDGEFFLIKFFEMIDMSYKDENFPIDRAAKLFIERYIENFSHLLSYYISGAYSDVKKYIEDCKQRLQNTVFESIPLYDDFAHKEIDYLFITLKAGFENFFKVDRINGNFKTYIQFIEALKNKLEKWESSLKSISEGSELIELEDDFKKATKRIEHLQKKKILSFIVFRNIRQKLIENAILSLPIENYLESLIKQKLAASFYEYWKSLIDVKKSPIEECNKILANLKNLETRFKGKEQYLLNKIQFIENMNESYYILPMFESSDDYSKLLERIKNRNFGSHNTQKIKDAVTNALKLYVAEKDIYGITQNPTEFINFIENNYIPNNQKLFSDIEDKIDEFYDFSKRAVEETKYKTENINSISFETKGTSLFQNEIILTPNNMKPDCLSEEIDSKFDSSLEKVEIPKDFTIGSVMYFKDYLYMSQKDMKKKDFLENYKNLETSEPKYDNSLTEKVSFEREAEDNNDNKKDLNTNQTNLWKYTRSVLNFYMDKNTVLNLYNKNFGTSNENISDNQIEELSKIVSFEDVLNELSEDKLTEFSKDNNVPVKSNKEKQIKLIVHEFLER